jgi:glycosyltransferase involved in cell wall biosynthesis
MKVLYIHQYFKTPREPGVTRSYWLARKLVEAGHEVRMLTSRNEQNIWIERQQVDGIEVIYIRNRYSNQMGLFRRAVSFFMFMLLSSFIAIQEKHVDLVFATSTPLTVGLPALLLRWIKKIPFIFEVRDLWPEAPIQLGGLNNKWLQKLAFGLERTIYQQAVHVIALSPGMQERICQQGVSPQKVSLIPNLAKKEEFYPREVNPELAKAFHIDLNRFNVIYFGALGFANGLHYILEAAKLLKKNGEQDIEFLFLGEGKMEEELKAVCEEFQLHNVRFLGAHPMKLVSEIVNMADCSVVSFKNVEVLNTSSPNKLFESLSAALPVIVNSDGWTKQLVELKDCGLYADPEKPQELVNAIEYLRLHEAERKQMGQNARKLAQDVYDKSVLGKKFVEVIENYAHI